MLIPDETFLNALIDLGIDTNGDGAISPSEAEVIPHIDVSERGISDMTGIEALKRLLKNSLIEEFDDPDDKRAKRIRITEKGKTEMQKVLPEMEKVFHSMTAEMSLNEKLHVVSFLKSMNDYHIRHTTNL